MNVNYENAPTTLLNDFWPQSSKGSWVRSITLAFIGTLLLTLCAKIQLPIGPVPITLQTFGVLLIGSLCGWRLAGGTILLYLAEGMMGLPVFAGSVAGPAYFAGPTAGFLLGFVLAALVVGGLSERGWGRNPATMFFALLIGNTVLYLPGLLWLQTFTGWSNLLQVGLTPFLFGDALKLALVTFIIPLAWDFSNRKKIHGVN